MRMAVTERQEAGFKFGKNPVKVINEVHHVEHQGRTYRILNVEADNKPYVSIRLYNAKNHFIKQLMMEPVVALKFGLIKET